MAKLHFDILFLIFKKCFAVNNFSTMKIGFDAKRAFNNTAGLGNFSRNSISALAHQYPEDLHFLFHPGKMKLHFKMPVNSVQVQPESLWWKFLRNSWRIFHIAKIINDHDLDIYHGLSHELPVGIDKIKIKSVVTIHDLIYLRYPEYYHRIDRKIYDQKFRYSCRVATRIHAISEQTKRDVITYFDVPANKIEVIYQSINPVFFETANESEIPTSGKIFTDSWNGRTSQKPFGFA